MNNDQILKKAIEKAEKNGYDFWGNGLCGKCDKFIFSHDFAKAFWGTNDDGSKSHPVYLEAKYKHHLQQMVISEDPIKYLSKFI